MNLRQRFHAVLNGKPVDEMPVLEWASWWDQTLDGWYDEGLPKGMTDRELQDHFGLAHHTQFWLSHKAGTCPKDASHGAGILHTAEDYHALREHLLPDDAVQRLAPQLRALQAEHAAGDTLLWYTLDGFFWWPRVLFGIENHFFSFYDEPELYHEICEDLLQWQIKRVDELAQYGAPDFMTIAEDMSYNHGPMLSKALFDEFLLPYYKRLVPEIKKHGTRVFVDSDGDITSAVPWFVEAGIEGILPLERQSGVDVAKIRALYPDFLMLGSFDKMCMFKAPQDIEAEVQRVLPTLRKGGYLPAMDHQTPPGTPLANYHAYVALMQQYGKQACLDVPGARAEVLCETGESKKAGGIANG